MAYRFGRVQVQLSIRCAVAHQNERDCTMSSQFPQVFKSPQLSIYSRSSGSRHARTKIPRYLRDADQTLKSIYNWGRWDASSADAITAKHDELVKMLRVIHAQLAAGITPAPAPHPVEFNSDEPQSITALVERFIGWQMESYESAKGLVSTSARTQYRSNMKLKLDELVWEHGLLRIRDFNGRELIQIRERLMNVGTIRGNKIKTPYGNKILQEIRKVFGYAILMGWAPSVLETELKQVRMIQNDRRAKEHVGQRIPSNEEIIYFCSLFDFMHPARGVLEFMHANGCRVAQAIRMRWCDIRPAQTQGWFSYVPTVAEGCSFAKGKEVFINPELWSQMQRFRTRDGKLVPEDFPVFDASTRQGNQIKSEPGTPFTCHTLYNACQRHAKNHGIEMISPRTIRKRVARNNFDAGGIDAAQAMLGHRNSQMTDRYLQQVRGEVPEILTKIHREVG